MSDSCYASVVGSLMYAMLCTQSDIYFGVGMVSHYQSHLGSIYWQAIKRIMYYLHGTADLVIFYQGEYLKSS